MFVRDHYFMACCVPLHCMHCDVLYEDNHLLAINKPAGMLVQGDRTGDRTVLDICKDYIAAKYNKPGRVFLGLAHRIDRPVSGVVVLARTSKALTRLNALFKNREVQKTYLALTDKKPGNQTATLVHWISKDREKNRVHLYQKPKDNALKCELHYRVIDHRQGLHLIEVQPITGRPHQIRAQLAAIGCPILGDLKYGHKVPGREGNIALHAYRIGFIHPVKKVHMAFEAPLPASEFWASFSDWN